MTQQIHQHTDGTSCPGNLLTLSAPAPAWIRIENEARHAFAAANGLRTDHPDDPRAAAVAAYLAFWVCEVKELLDQA